MENAIQTWPGCGSGLVRASPDDERANWTADRQAELMMGGLSESDALRKAMEDWHTYKVPNEPAQRPAESGSGAAQG